MLPVRVTRPDPAPSRIKYRLERLWLRPVVQRLVRVYLPALVVGVGIAMVGLHPRVQATARAQWQQLHQSLATRPELMVFSIETEGAGPGLEGRIRQALQLDLPASALELDLAGLQDRVQALDPVLHSRLRVTEDGVLRIDVTERTPSAVWRNADGLFLIDTSGARVDRIEQRSARNDLPLVAGQGAEAAVGEALHLLEIAAPIMARVRGLVRVGERRWDLVLDRGLIVRLPETGADAALSRVLALQFAEDVLDRDVVVVDMRDGRRPLLRLNDPALEKLRKPTLIKPEGEDV